VAALLDAMPDATAVLDRNGTIVAVNRAWRMFSVDNGGIPDRTGIGANYFAVCERAASAGCEDAAAVVQCLRSVLAGGTIEAELEYPCPAPAIGRWFVLRVTRIAGDEPGLLIGHVNISRRKMAEQDLERKASQDPLTSLANRALFVERLAAAMAPSGPTPGEPDVGVLLLDLDGFKPVNDTYGHAAGDEVLQAVAARIRAQVREGDTVARLGGDEFAVVAPRVTAGWLAAMAACIDLALQERHLIHGELVSVGASVGFHLAAADDVDPLERADAAMYEVKRRRQAGR
jgi:diguanylate cyclase (GGDEF)-like protein